MAEWVGDRGILLIKRAVVKVDALGEIAFTSCADRGRIIG